MDISDGRSGTPRVDLLPVRDRPVAASEAGPAYARREPCVPPQDADLDPDSRVLTCKVDEGRRRSLLVGTLSHRSIQISDHTSTGDLFELRTRPAAAPLQKWPPTGATCPDESAPQR